MTTPASTRPAATTVAGTRPYTASIARSGTQVRAAQRLRQRVFTAEFGANLPAGGDTDEFDAICDHLVVRSEEAGAEVVGTYRLLPPGRGERLYSSTEFDLAALAPLLPGLVEVGRSCVAPGHRDGAVISTMWSALLRYTTRGGYRYLAGCASVPLADGGEAAASTWRLALTRHAAPAHLRVVPHHPWTPDAPMPDRPRYTHLPPLLRGYLRLGAWVCGPPAHDPDFGVADFFVLLPLERVDARYSRFLTGGEHR
ncbi:GNAT family N-acetyltransferase [Saccharomonospora saliphila]|uniref:GNAT family N-acetyltransferase n=1 Tax=Saccharomonospora saliphila TaxID=369829 RepID=UPI00035D1FC9|nr:GNAT family N-acyltransferase [Saccharomonospora saliphila]